MDADVFKELEKFGRFQTLQYFWICLPLFVVSMSIVNYVFVAEKVNYRCIIPECESAPTIEVPTWWPRDLDTKCVRPLLNNSAQHYHSYPTCSNYSFTGEWKKCDAWIYESDYSLVSELNLACQMWKATLVGSVHNSGMIASMMLAGWMSDKIGRKPAIILCSLGGGVGIMKIFMTNYYAYLTIEFLESFFSSGLFTVGVVMMIEVGGESNRVIAGVVFSYATYVGEFVFPFLAMGIQYWKHLILITYTPFLFFASYGLVLRESTRWQMLRGKMAKAKETFKLIAKMNKLKVSSEQIDEISDEALRAKFNVRVQLQKENIREITRSKVIMLRLAVTSVCFLSASFIYCGLVVHTVLLPGNKYTNFALGALTAFPGDFFAYWSFIKFGRRITLQGGFCASAIFIIAQACTPERIPWMKIILFLFGKFSVVICFTGMFTYSMELFPTSVRGALVGCGNTAARVGSMLAPLTPLLNNIRLMDLPLPPILFASTALISGLLLTFTPETKLLPMFDTVAQIHEYHQNK